MTDLVKALQAVDTATTQLAQVVLDGAWGGDTTRKSILQRALAIQELAGAYDVGRPIYVHEGLLYGYDAQVCVWVSERLGGGFVPGTAVAIGALRPDAPTDPTAIDIERDLIAGAYFHSHYNAEVDGISDIVMAASVAPGANVGRSTIRALLDYPFKQLNVRRITAMVAASNAEGLTAAKAMGFVEEGRKRYMAPDSGDVVVLGLYAKRATELGLIAA